ncbi:MAG: H+/Na+-translocating ferredoxin:NAD+ oxidoreductase subunit [Bacteroidota bacterium]|nr:H+/Na+-translocating ferredoxin:NAD+ oxidoreductase subunit [Bacteroidota bacterium]
MNQLQNFTKGFFKENPILVLVLGTCPTLATSTSVLNGMGMGIATTFVLIGSNVVISLLSGVIPDKVRIPAFVVIIASFVTIVDLLMQAFVPSLYQALGIFIPLIVVNCIVLGRAEAYASKNSVLSSFIDGAGMGLGFTMALGILGAFREIVGSGTIFGYKFIQGDGILVFILAPGAFWALGYLIALINRIKRT